MVPHARTLSFTPHTHLLIPRPAPQLAAGSEHYRAQKIARPPIRWTSCTRQFSIQNDCYSNCGINFDHELYLGMELDREHPQRLYPLPGPSSAHPRRLPTLPEHWRRPQGHRNSVFRLAFSVCLNELFWVNQSALPDCRRRSARRRACHTSTAVGVGRSIHLHGTLVISRCK